MNVQGMTRDLSLSDTPNAEFTHLMVTTIAGSIIYVTSTGEQETLASVPVGEWIPVGRSTHVTTASTAVGIMVV